MSVEFDERSGRVRCTDTELETLFAQYAEGPVASTMDHRVVVALGAVGDARVRGRVVVATVTSIVDHRFWIAPSSAAVFHGRLDGRGDFAGAPPAWVPAMLARLVCLGPRRVPAERARTVVESELLQDAFAVSDLRRASALEMLAADRAWHLDVEGSAGHLSQRQSMTVLDGRAGLWIAGLEPSTIEPATSSMLWRRLAGLLS